MSDSASNASSAGRAYVSATDYGESSLINQNLTTSNPGTYEDLHKKTKGSTNKYLTKKFKILS